MQGSWFEFWSAHWWLIFPLFWMVLALARLWSRHSRAQQTLNMVKSYIDQGKEPPTELLKILQPGSGGDCGDGRSGLRGFRGSWVSVCLFAALACGFIYMAVGPDGGGLTHGHRASGLIFTAIIMAGLSIGNLITLFTRNRAADLGLPK